VGCRQRQFIKELKPPQPPGFKAIEDDGLSLEVSDVELEAAAGETTHPAMTFPAAPTVSDTV
jgi:hypothetical protein